MKNLFGGGMYDDKKDVQQKKVYSKLPDFYIENSQVYFDIAIGNPDDEKAHHWINLDLKSSHLICSC